MEWAHAIAPDANILVVAADDLLTGANTARNYPGVSVVSMSFGNIETTFDKQYNSNFTTPIGHSGVTFVASSGDHGFGSYPAFSPNVVAVGGTMLTLNPDNSWSSETGWEGSGGGRSYYEDQPVYQQVVPSSMSTVGNVAHRTNPDVSFVYGPVLMSQLWDLKSLAFRRPLSVR